MALDEAQRRQLEMQLRQHHHQRYETDMELSGGEVLRKFVVHPRVLRPEKMSARILAGWLHENRSLYTGKTAIDMGCGSGIQGTVMGVYGAEGVIFSDLSPAAAANTRENVERFGLGDISEVHEGDLFEKISGTASIIVFNHPFFSDSTFEQLLVSASMLDQGKLIHRFFDDSRGYLNEGGSIIMPYYHVAGPVNDPEVQAPEHGLTVTVRFRKDIHEGLQKGLVSIYQIQP